jgi:outer membrane protein assembly factor BamB
MKNADRRTIAVLSGSVLLMLATSALAQSWPQWRGPNRDAKASGFTAPKEWPKELKQQWKVSVGQGDATPALVGDKLYVFARQDGRERALALDAATGKELWREEGYEVMAPTGPSSRHPGPRSSPVVADGKMIIYGVRGNLSCLNASDGKAAWRKDDFSGAWPQFFTSASPLIADGLCIAQLGGPDKGGINAYALASGDQKWSWTGDGTGYSSPVLATIGGAKQVVAMTAKKIVGLNAADGKLLWETSFAGGGRMSYNAATPIVDGSIVTYTGSGRGTKSITVEKQGDAFATKDQWANSSASVQFNTPVLKNGLIYGLAQNGDLFCLKASDGTTAWTEPKIGGNGFGSIVDAGSALVALNPKGELTVFQPNDKAFKKNASYKVAESEVYAYPVLSGNRIYVKDQESVTLWTLE